MFLPAPAPEKNMGFGFPPRRASVTLVIVNGQSVLDGSLNLLGTVSGMAKPWSAFAPSSAVAYRAATGEIQIVNLSQFAVTGSIPLTVDTIDLGTGSAAGNLAVSSDGKWATVITVITDHGFAFVNLP
jgi:hypothetical protein